MKLNFVRLAAVAALTLSASAAFAAPTFGPAIPSPLPTMKGFAASSFGPAIPSPLPTMKG